MDSLARAWPALPLCADLRSVAEDFAVTEVLPFEPEGSGDHLWCLIEKRGCNTAEAVAALARWAETPPADIGLAGLKDRHAVARQWLSVPVRAGAILPPTALGPGLEVLAAVRHPRKLRRGVHRGNRFTLRLRQLSGDREGLVERLHCIAVSGFPNYFGEQRFGYGGANLARALGWVKRGGRLTRTQRSLHFSVLRASVFNDLLSQRVEAGTWATLVAGDICQLRGTASVFVADTIDATLDARCARADVGPALPLVGAGELLAGGAQRAWLDLALAPHAAITAALVHAGVDLSYRAARCVPEALEWTLDDEDLMLSFMLPSGSFATALLREVLAYRDVAGRAPPPAATGAAS